MFIINRLKNDVSAGEGRAVPAGNASDFSFYVSERPKYRFVMEYNNAAKQKLKLSMCFFRAII
jgi:hypothetical protein